MRHLGLIIGVNHYQDNTFRRLQFAENDARALAQWLVNTKGGKWSPSDVQLIQGSHATHDLVFSQIQQLCTMKAGAEDTILLYFACQSFIDERSGDGYIALANTSSHDVSSGLSLRVLYQQVLAQSRAAHILCIFDCWQTGQVWNMRRTSAYDCKPLFGSSLLNTIQQQRNRLFLCSCRGNDKVSEEGERQLGAFVHGVILGLCGPASESSTGNVTLTRLHAYLFRTLNEQQRPQLFGQQEPPLIVVGHANPPEQQVALAGATGNAPSKPGSPFLQPKGQMKTQAAAVSTQTPPVSPGPTTSDRLQTSALDSHRTQQCQQLVAQAQQQMQNQQFGLAFDLVEQALQVIPDDTEALILKGQLLGTASRFQETLVIIEHVLQRAPDHPLAWSMQAVALSNMGQQQAALAAIERSLELDAHNPESYGIRTTIMANMAAEQVESSQIGGPPMGSPFQSQDQPVRENTRSFLLGAGIHLLALICGGLGCGLLFIASLPGAVGLVLASLGLAILCVNTLRGTFRYGLARLVLPLLTALAIGGGLAAGYRVAFDRIVFWISQTPTSLLPVLFSLTWAGAAAALPLFLGFFSLIAGFIARARRK